MVSVGVKVIDTVREPAPSTTPTVGEYTKVPGIFAVASSCVELSAVPKVMAVGATQVIAGVALAIVNVNACVASGPAPLCAVIVNI